MPRRKLIRQNTFPYHVTTRTNNKNWFQIPLSEVWNMSKQSLLYAQGQSPVIIHSFLLMSNHYHLLLTTPNDDIDKFMKSFNFKLSLLISKNSGVLNHKFSNRYHWSIVENNHYLKNVYRYIYQNPVRAGIVQESIHYPYCSLHFSNFESNLMGLQPHYDYFKSKLWFEKRYGNELDSLIRNGLRKEKFKPSSRLSTKMKSVLDLRE